MSSKKKNYLEEALEFSKKYLNPWHYVAIKNLQKSHHDLIEKTSTDRIKEKQSKGLYSVDDDYVPYEGGMHTHYLDRENLSTYHDGGHRHMFLVNGVNILTDLDGNHAHELESEDSDSMSMRGDHSHRLILPRGLVLSDDSILSEDIEITTNHSGEHDHELQVYQTGVDGGHHHYIRLPDETVVASMSPGEYWKHAGVGKSRRSEAPVELTKLGKSGPTGNKINRKNKP
jgi:hypothetical protein